MRAGGLVALLLVLGCGGKAPAPAASTPDSAATRNRQEALGKSGIPGAGGINRALDIADTAAARNQRLDSISP